MKRLKFSDDFFKDELRCGFHITSMMKRLWAVQMDILAWIDDVCREHDIKYIMFLGSMLGAVRHKGFIPWDDDMDIAMLRSDYSKFMEVVARELPSHLNTSSLLPGAIFPGEMVYNVNNGNRLNTSPEFLERFHGCPYATGVDIFVFDKIPDDPNDFAYQDRLIKILDRMLMLQREIDGNSISKEDYDTFCAFKNATEQELGYTFNDAEPMNLQILRLQDMACALSDDCDSKRVEIWELFIYHGHMDGMFEEHFNDRIYVPFENMMNVPIPRDYDELLRKHYGDYETPKLFGSSHKYPIYCEQRIALYKAYNERGWDIPEEFLEYDENGDLVLDPKTV